MKVFVVLAVAVACASANPQLLLNNLGYGLGLHGLHHGLVHHPALLSAPAVTYAAAPAIVAPLATKTQYHAQDELGQASFGHAHAGNAHAAVRDAFGNVRGSYAYINPDGKEIRVEYTAGHGGFQVASNALPVAPVDTNSPVVANLVAPSPVQDTPEVVEARAAHAKAVADAIARNADAEKADADKPQSRRKRGLIAAAPIAYSAIAHPAITYSAIAHPVAVPVAATYVAAPALREATLTKVVNNPLHAVSYRVD